MLSYPQFLSVRKVRNGVVAIRYARALKAPPMTDLPPSPGLNGKRGDKSRLDSRGNDVRVVAAIGIGECQSTLAEVVAQVLQPEPNTAKLRSELAEVLAGEQVVSKTVAPEGDKLKRKSA